MSAGCARRSTAATRPTRSAPCAAPATRSTIASARRRSEIFVARMKRSAIRGSCHASRLFPHCASLHAGYGLNPLSSERPPIAADVGRLIGDARMVGTVGQAGDGLAAAEEEVGAAGIADRPAAGLLGE